jgi:hypothetical protein
MNIFMEKLKMILRRFKSLLGAWWYNVSSQPLEAKYGAFLFHLIALLAALLLLLGIGGCSTVKYVPIQTEEKVIVKDSLIYVRDTITVEIPKEVIKEIVPADTTSILKTSLAMSEARLEEGRLYHSLEQSGAVKTVVDTCYVTRIEEKVVFQDRPIEVPKEVKHIPSFFWWSLIFNIITVLFIIFKIYLKLKP